MRSRRCPFCKDRYLRVKDGTVVMHVDGPLTVSAAGVCSARCMNCKQTINIPVELAPDARPASPTVPFSSSTPPLA
jgi:hypothetical protein